MNPGRIVVFLFIISFLLVSTAWAGSYDVLHDFLGTDGSTPVGSLICHSNRLYGVCQAGGAMHSGTVFCLNKDGTGFQALHHFGSVLNDANNVQRGLLYHDGRIYGMSPDGGDGNKGLIYSLKPDGSDYTVMYRFQNPPDARDPYGSLIYHDGYLYGLGSRGGTYHEGAIFRIKPDATSYQVVFSFADTTSGEEPLGSLLAHSNRFYGTTQKGGVSNAGAIFSIKPDGSDCALLYSFTDRAVDGAEPWGALTLYSNQLFGLTSKGGVSGDGVVFRINTDGSGYTNLYDLNDYAGSEPYGNLAVRNGRLYALVDGGGLNGKGTLVSLNPDGSGFAILHGFPAFDGDGEEPDSCTPLVEGNVLYGTADGGGASNDGIVFAVSGAVAGPEPGSVPDRGGSLVNLYGLNLGDGSDISSVSLAGTDAMIVTQGRDYVHVRPGASSEKAGDIVVTSASEGETKRTNAVVYSPYTVSETTYSWDEISGSGTVIAGLNDQDDAIAGIPIGFNFEFFGETKTNIYVDTNGYLSFFDDEEHENFCLGLGHVPNNLLAVFWQDLKNKIGMWAPDIYYQVLGIAPNRRLVVEYYQVSHFNDDKSKYTFEVVLHEGSNDIIFQYKTLQNGEEFYAGGGAATIGIEDSTGRIYTAWSCFEKDAVRESMAILFSTNRGAITTVSPNYGPQYGGNEVKIHGERLGSGDVGLVSLNGVPADILPGQSATQVVVAADMASAPGTGEVVVYSDSLGMMRLNDGYTYNPWYRPRISWDATSGASWYRLWVNRDGNTYFTTWLEGKTEWQPDWDMYPIDYTWWVQPWGTSIGYGPWSAANDLEIPWPTMQWDATSGATWYNFWIGRNGAEYYSDWLEGSTNWLPSWNFSPGRYRMWIQPWSATAGSGTWQQFTNFVVRGKPLAWDPVGGATWYRVWLNQDGTDYYDRWVESDAFITLDWRLPAGTYEWWTQPWGPTIGYGAWSAGRGFSVSYGTPGAAVPRTPSGTTASTRPEFRWDTNGESWYYLWINREGSFYFSEWIEYEGGWTPPWNFDAGNYEWWIQTWNSSGYGAWSASMTFIVP